VEHVFYLILNRKEMLLYAKNEKRKEKKRYFALATCLR